MTKGNLHEGFSHHTEDKKATEKNLGQVFATVCALIAAIRFYHGHADAAWWLLASALFLLLACFWTAPLKPLNRFWHALGLFLFMVVNPLIMGVVYYLAVMPTGLLMRLFGKDPLKLAIDKNAESYWVIRDPAGPSGADMQNQF